MPAGKEVAVAPTAQEANIAKAKEMVAAAVVEMTRPDQTAEEIALQILQATSIDQILGSTVVHLQDMVGVPFLVTEALLTKSDYEDGLGAYTVMSAIMGDGSKAVITSGAQNVVAQVIAMHSGKHFPQWCMATKTESKAGFTVYRLQRAPGEAPTQAQLESF
jgi:hypothetical protein